MEQIPDKGQLESAAAAGFTHFPFIREIIEDVFTPVGLYLRLRNFGMNSFLLESAEGGEHIGRYSFMGVDPFATFLVEDGTVTVKVGDKESTSKKPPISELKKFFSQFKIFPAASLPRFSGGAVGYFGYDFVRYLEAIDIHESNTPLPEVFLNFYDTILVVDNLKRKVLLVSLVPITGSADSVQKAFEGRSEYLERIKDCIRAQSGQQNPTSCKVSQPRFNVTRDSYKKMVERAKEYIIEGDIFQVVLSQRAEFDLEGDPFLLYRGVRALNPSSAG